MTVVLLLFFTMPFLAVHAAPCGCKFSNFKLHPCAKSNNSFWGSCGNPYMDENCSGGGIICYDNNTLGPITSAELEILGMASLLPITLNDPQACRGTHKVKPYQLFGEVITSVNKLCALAAEPKISFHVPLNEEEKRLLPAIAGHHKFTLKAKNMNGDRKNHICFVLEADFRCKNALSNIFNRN